MKGTIGCRSIPFEMKKVISFSLWGTSPKYLVGSIRNANLALKHYPDWTCRFYIDYQTVPFLTQMSLSLMPNVELFEMVSGVPRMMQRFLVHDDPEVGRYLVRDTDSRIGPEEVAAVKEWIREDTILHTCRAHPAHARPINGGMWGMTPRRADGWEAPKMSDMIRDFLAVNRVDSETYSVDQSFLSTTVWSWARVSTTQHDAVCRQAYKGSKPFPVKWPWPRFMGEVIEVDEKGNERFRDGDWQSVPKE